MPITCYNSKCSYNIPSLPDHCGHFAVLIKECKDAITERPKGRLHNSSEYYEMLKSEECHCGAEKKSGYSFCPKCYYSLPPDMRRDLYNPIGHGYEEAYESAVEYLEREVL